MSQINSSGMVLTPTPCMRKHHGHRSQPAQLTSFNCCHLREGDLLPHRCHRHLSKWTRSAMPAIPSRMTMETSCYSSTRPNTQWCRQ